MIKLYNVESLYSALYGVVGFLNLHKDENVEIVVPDKLSLFMEKFLFEHMNIEASFNIQVSTLNRFAKRTCAVDKKNQISKVGSILLIHKILNDNLEKFKVLRNKAYSFTYAEDIYKTIAQLKASKIGFEEMKRFSSRNERLTDKIQDLAMVYQAYETDKAGLLDVSDVFLMSTLTVSKGMENKTIIFVGFDDFTAIQYSIIEQLAKVANVFVFNYQTKSCNKHIFNHEIKDQLKNIALINELPFEIEDFEIIKSELKAFMENNLFGLKAESFCLKNETIKVFSGNNFASEIGFVARDIRMQILQGQRFDSFGVAVYGLEGNEQKIKEIFEKYEINYYIDSEISLNKSIIYKFYLSILKYNLDGYRLSHIIDVINSPFFKMSEDEKRQVINELISVNFRGKIDFDLSLKIDEEVKTKLIKQFKLLNFDKDINIIDIISKFRKLFDDFGIQYVVDIIVKDNLQYATLLNKSKEIIFNLFDDIEKFIKNVDAETFLDIFNHASSVVKIANLPLSLDAVKIVDANNFMEIVDNLYVVGATHDNAPSLKFDCGIILDSEIEKLNFSNKLNPTIAHINRLMKLRLYNMINLFEKNLTITYSNSQSDVVKELLNKIKIETKLGVQNIAPISKFTHGKIVALSKWNHIEEQCKQNKINENHFKIAENLSKNAENIIKNKKFNQISKNNLKIFDEFNNVSATTLENYFACPFYAFLNNILKIQPRMDSQILSLDIGNILHKIVFEYYQREKKVEDIYLFCKEQVFECVEKDQRLKLNAKSPILVNLIDEAVRVINAVNYIDENSLFKPHFFEYEFKDKNALKLKNILINGKVDRVDVYNDMFRIVDYKSGKANANLEELYYGNKLQLFLYACAIEDELKLKGVGSFYLPLHNAYEKELTNSYALKGFYLAEDFVVKAFDPRLVEGKKSDIVNVKLNKDGTIAKFAGHKELESAEFHNLKEYSKKVSEQAVEELKGGFIAPTPNDVKEQCDFCPYGHICMRNSNGVKTRKAKSLNLDSFKGVHDERI